MEVLKIGGDINTAKEFFMKRVLVFLIVGVVFFGACSAQSVNAQNSNIGQRIIGTWIDQDGGTWVFNTNGTLTWGSGEKKFGVTDTQLAIIENNGRNFYVFNISISSDGRTLILTYVNANAREIGFGYWLTKR